MADYNERIIAGIDDNFFSDLLSNPSYYKQLMKEKLGRFNPNNPCRCSKISQLDKLENYIVKCVLENPNKLNRNDILGYRDYLYSLFVSEPFVVNESLLFKKNVLRLLFNDEQCEKIEEFKRSYNIQIKATATKISKKMPITKEEKNNLLGFLISNINDNRPSFNIMKQNMCSYLMQNPSNNSLLEKEFLLKFMASEVARENNIPPVEVYISDDSLSGDSHEKANGKSYHNTSIISINRKIACSRDEDLQNQLQQYKNIVPLVKMIQTVAHETNHSKQSYEAANNKLTFSSIEAIRSSLFAKYLSKDEYHTNYSDSEIERDSNIQGWLYTVKFLEKYNPSLVKSMDHSISASILTDYKASLGSKRNSKRTMLKYKYNVHYLDLIIKQHPQELQNYPQLLDFYNEDGSRKSFIELINSEEKNSTSKDVRLNEVYNEYYLNMIDFGLLDINLNTLKEEEQFKVVLRINDVLERELRNVSKSITLLSKTNINNFNSINNDRLERISKLLNFFHANKNTIDALIALDVRLHNIHALGFSLNVCNSIYENVKHKIKITEGLKETAIYDELLNVSEGGYGNGPRL